MADVCSALSWYAGWWPVDTIRWNQIDKELLRRGRYRRLTVTLRLGEPSGNLDSWVSISHLIGPRQNSDSRLKGVHNTHCSISLTDRSASEALTKAESHYCLVVSPRVQAPWL